MPDFKRPWINSIGQIDEIFHLQVLGPHATANTIAQAVQKGQTLSTKEKLGIEFTIFFMRLFAKEGGILFCFCRSVCIPSAVRAISFDLFAWKLPNLVQWLPLESRRPVTKVKVKLLIFIQWVVYSISLFDVNQTCDSICLSRDDRFLRAYWEIIASSFCL